MSDTERLEVLVTERPDADDPMERFRAEWPDDGSRFYAMGETRKEAVSSFIMCELHSEVADRCVPEGDSA